MTALVSTRIEQRVAFVTINNPPVNGLNRAVRAGLCEAFEYLRERDDVVGVVLSGGGRCFSAGGDIREFGTPNAAADPGLSKHIHPAIERCGKTVVAAIHGYALGGGLETAMACHYRVATPDARLGLPEALIGVIPLSGTQRLPRLVGIEAAIDMILNARELLARDAPSDLIEAVAEGNDLIEVATDLANRPAPALARDLPYPPDAARAFGRVRELVAAGAYQPFATHLLAAMECGIGASFEDGVRGARAIYDSIVNSPESQAARATFFASRAKTGTQQ